MWHNLLLLGLEAAALAAQRIDVGPAMFDRPNPRGLHALLHFILLKLKSCPQADAHNSSGEWRELPAVFAHSYPCIDRSQARDFLNVCVGSLVGFEKGPAGVFPPGTIRKSHFAAPQGDRSGQA